jgi:hypothetical protein
MTYSFNVLIATIGRPTLQRMLDSLYPQLDAIDCLTIVFDGHASPPVFDISNFKCKVFQYCEPIPLGFFGHGIRNKYASILEKRDFVMHGDDDDIYLEDSFNQLRKMIVCNNTLYIAKLIAGNIHLGCGPYICVGNIGTPNGIVPYNLNQLGEWKPFYGGDGEFYITISNIAKKTEYLNIVIYRVRP